MDKRSEGGAHCVAKIMVATAERKEDALAELAALKAAQHLNVPVLHAAYLRYASPTRLIQGK